MSNTKLLYHIVIRTKYSHKTIPNEHADELYRYMWVFIKNKKSVLYRINGMPEHIHLFVQLHPTIAVSDFVRDLKTSSHTWLDTQPHFPDFLSWSKKYCALSYGIRDKGMIVNYIKRQREHHHAEEFHVEFRRLLEENQVEIDERYYMEE